MFTVTTDITAAASFPATWTCKSEAEAWFFAKLRDLEANETRDWVHTMYDPDGEIVMQSANRPLAELGS